MWLVSMYLFLKTNNKLIRYGAEINAAVMTFKYSIPTVYTVFRMLLIAGNKQLFLQTAFRFTNF